MKRPTNNNADHWQLFLSEWLRVENGRIEGMAYCAVQIAEALDTARQQGREEIMREVFALHEDTVERYHDIGQRDTEGKPGAYAHGRCAEAKSIARAIGEVVQSRALAAAPTTGEAIDGYCCGDTKGDEPEPGWLAKELTAPAPSAGETVQRPSEGAVAALAAYQQGDMDGCMVLVSRQAIDECLPALRALAAAPTTGETP